jgi:hypothetical protein
MLTVLITYTDGTTDIRDCYSLDELSHSGVATMRILRDTTARAA